MTELRKGLETMLNGLRVEKDYADKRRATINRIISGADKLLRDMEMLERLETEMLAADIEEVSK
jgi:hypothetical protein